ncbi:MAG: Hsp20/alpha crystallin family protein [Candidatus Bathyarchaeia archaeon]|nr:Hsp20/alpha crystallin family protein [Candidatus Bathyarchaeota archaeon]
MRWRRSNRRPKWFKAVRRLDEAEGRKHLKTIRFDEFKAKGNPYTYPRKRLKIDGKTASQWKEPKPLLDVFDDENYVIIVTELKGFKRENIKINVEKNQLTLLAKSQNRRYCRRLTLPETVVPESMYTTYKNGVLEIRLKKAIKESTISKMAG